MFNWNFSLWISVVNLSHYQRCLIGISVSENQLLFYLITFWSVLVVCHYCFSIYYQYDFRVADVINLTSFVSTDNVKYSVLIIFYWRHYWYWHHKIFNLENDEWYSSLGIWNKVWFKSSWTVSLERWVVSLQGW